MPATSPSRSSLEATIELNIPAVLGGAQPLRCDPYFRVRPSSVRGGLRYWFRAGMASVLWPDHNKKPNEQREHDNHMLDQLRKLEAHVFGDTKGRSRVIVLPPEGGVVERWRPRLDPKDAPGLRYLGYGLFEGGDTPERLVAGPDRPITLTLALRDSEPALRQAVAASLWLWTTFGGLGARSRRGYGSMRLATLEGAQEQEPFAQLCALRETSQAHLEQIQAGIGQSQDAFIKLVQTLKHGQELLANNGTRPHPHLRTIDGIARLRALKCDHEDPLAALEYAGDLFQRYRSTIKRRVPLPDYHAVKESLQPPFRSPQTVVRADFGLPLNFYFRSRGGARVQYRPVAPDGLENSDRVASPLLFRVYALQPKAGVRRYGVMLTNLAGRNTSALLGCSIASSKSRGTITAPTAGLIDQFIDWAVQESKRQPPHPARTTPKRRRRT